MTLQEQLEYWYYEPSNGEDADLEKLKDIAEKFACNFTEWFWYHGTKYWRGERRDYLSMEEILKIYKEEHNL